MVVGKDAAATGFRPLSGISGIQSRIPLGPDQRAVDKFPSPVGGSDSGYAERNHLVTRS